MGSRKQAFSRSPWRERILRHTQCVRGLRIRVSDILDFVAAGASYEEVLADYPFLEREDLLAAIGYAARQADQIVFAIKFLIDNQLPAALSRFPSR